VSLKLEIVAVDSVSLFKTVSVKLLLKEVIFGIMLVNCETSVVLEIELVNWEISVMLDTAGAALKK